MGYAISEGTSGNTRLTGNLFSMKVENLSLLDNLFRNVLSNPFIWLGQYSSFC